MNKKKKKKVSNILRYTSNEKVMARQYSRCDSVIVFSGAPCRVAHNRVANNWVAHNRVAHNRVALRRVARWCDIAGVPGNDAHQDINPTGPRQPGNLNFDIIN